MSKQRPLSPKGLTSPVGKSLLNAFSKTIDRMEARVAEKSKPFVQVDQEKEILRAFNVNLESHFSQKSGDKLESVRTESLQKIQFSYQGRSEAVFMNEHRRICNRAPFHMMYTDPQNEYNESMGEDFQKDNTKVVSHEMTLGRFEDSDHSSDEDIDAFSLQETGMEDAVLPSDTVSESCDGIPKLLIIGNSPSHQSTSDVDIHTSEQDDQSEIDSRGGDASLSQSAVTDTQTEKLHEKNSSSSKSVAEEQRRPKPMKFSAGNSYSDQTAAESRSYVLSMVGERRLEVCNKVSARRFYIESCEQQKITPHVSHISKFEGNGATYSSIKDSTANLKGIGEKRLMAISRFIQDRLKVDGSQLILRESLIGNEGCKILRNVALDSEIPCKIETLDLSENCFNAIGIAILSPLLNLSSIMRLVLAKLNLGDHGVCSLCEILCGSNHLKSTETVSIGEVHAMMSPKSPKCSPKISKRLSSACSQRSITFLDLSHNQVRTQGANAISNLIQCSNSLVHLELGWNAIGPSGSAAIEKSLQKNSNVTFLGLSWNGLDESGGIAMASLLGTSKFLQELDLGNNRISMLATCLISSALRQNTSIKTLNLSGNLVGKTGCKSLFKVIRWQQSYRHEKTLQMLEYEKLAELSLNHDGEKHEKVVEWPAASVNLDACIFEDQVNLDMGLNNCNGRHQLNMKIIKDRAKLAELMELSYAAEPLPSSWSNCSLDGKPFKMSTPANHIMPPTSGVFEGLFTIAPKACDIPNCIGSPSFSVVLQSIMSPQISSTNTKIAIAISHFSEFVYFSSQQVQDIMMCFDEPEAHYKILQHIYCKVVDIQQKGLFLTKLSQETIFRMKKRLGQLFDFSSEFPMQHYRIDLSQTFDVELFRKIQSTSTIQRRLAGSIRLPDTSQYSLLPMCIRNVQLNGVIQKDFAKLAFALPRAGVVELDFTSIMSQIPDRVPSLKECSDVCFMRLRQTVYAATSNSRFGLDILAAQLQENLYSITTKQTFFLVNLWPPISAGSSDERSESHKNLARLDAWVCCFSHISDLENIWPTLRSDSEYSWYAVQSICCRIGWLNIWNPLDADGYYELDLSLRDQRVVCECLVVLSVKEPGENWQDETFNGQRFELPVTWVTEVPDRGIVTLTYTSGLKKRNMLINIRKQLANRCLVRYCINQLPKNEADMIEEERKMEQMTSDAAAAAVAQGYADLAEDEESKELQELILNHTEAIMVQEGVIAAIHKEMDLRMMDDVQKYLELKKKLALEEEILEKQKMVVNVVIEEARRKVSAEALETFGIDAQESASTAVLDEETTSQN